MSSSVHSTKNQHFDGTRITVHSTQDFTTVMSKLYTELGSPSALQYPLIAKNITSYNESSKEAYISAVERAV
jgi:hypothetical protein